MLCLLLIANFWEHLEWAAAWDPGWHGERVGEQKEGDAGEHNKIYFLIKTFHLPPLSSGCLLALSPFPPSPLEMNGQTEGEMRPTGVERWGDNCCHQRLFPEWRKTQVTSISNCRLADEVIQEKERELKACRTVNACAYMCDSVNENMNTHIHIHTYQHLNRTHSMSLQALTRWSKWK